jgi:regulatory protein|uniref:Regulatory protein RecX n=1 Tax=candidate division WOR-3 bacterium TaxID=2052148 RepID=A0A7C3YS28_UNCW3
MKRLDFPTKVRNYALRLLARRSWGKEEFRQRLLSYLLRRKREVKKEEEEMVEEILREMEAMRLLDDKEFTNQFVRDALHFRKKGIGAIRKELKRKGVADEIVEEVLKDKEGEEEKSAIDLLNKYQKVYERMAERKGIPSEARAAFIKNKLREVLLRRGFQFLTIRRLLDI